MNKKFNAWYLPIYGEDILFKENSIEVDMKFAYNEGYAQALKDMESERKSLEILSKYEELDRQDRETLEQM